MKNYFTSFVLLLFCIQLQAQFAVGETTISFNDPARNNRTVTAAVRYPATSAGTNTPFATGEFPLLVFGHGFVMAYTEYEVWWDSLVPQCYIMVFPTTETSFSPNHGEFGADMAFLVATLQAENSNPSSIFFQKFNGKSGVMGHSMGGGASFLAVENNPAVDVHLSLAAAETNPSAIAAAANISCPSLVLAGSKDCVTPPADHQIPMYNALTAPYRAYIEITDANHCNFGIASFLSNCVTGQAATFCSGYISQSSQHIQMIATAKPWLDYHLKDDCAAWDTFYNYMTTTTTHTYMEGGTAPINYPTNINISLVTNTTATINWTAVTAAVQYTIEYCEQGTTNCMTVTSNTTSINLSGLNNNTTYEVRINADCGSGATTFSPVAIFITSGCAAVLNLMNTITSGTYQASTQILSNGSIATGANVSFFAGQCIDLQANFEVPQGAELLIDIQSCFAGDIIPKDR